MKNNFALFFLISLVYLNSTATFGQKHPNIIWERLAHNSDGGGFANTYSLRFSPDGQRIIAGGEKNVGSYLGSITVFETSTGTQIGATSNIYGIAGINDIALSSDGTRYFTSNNNISCNISTYPPTCRFGFIQWDAASLTDLSTPTYSPGNHWNGGVDVSPNGQLVAVGGTWFNYTPVDYDNIKILRADNLSLVRALPGHLRAPNNGGTVSLEFSPNGQLLVSTGRDSTVKIWRVSDGALLHTLGFDSYEIDSVAVSPDGQYVAAADRAVRSEVRVWRVSDGELVRVFENFNQDYEVRQKVTWTRDSRYVVTAVANNIEPSQIRFYNAANGQLARQYVLERPGAMILAIRFSPDGRTFAFGYRDRVVHARNPFPSSNLKPLGDFDGDGKADVSVYRDGNWYALLSSNNAFWAVGFGLPTDKLAPADYDSDNKTDVAVFRDGVWFILNSSNNTFRAAYWGQNGDAPVPGDYDGDGTTDIAIYRAGNWFVLQSSNSQTRLVSLGSGLTTPIPADYDGDGKFDFGVYRNGAWSLLRSKLGTANFVWGQTGDKAVPADYDGDGLPDPSVFSAGVWRILRSGGGTTVLPFGLPTDTPVPTDYDGDRKADIAVFRNGNWYINGSNSGLKAVSFGIGTDKPVQAAYSN